MREIAERAGVGIGTVYRRFPRRSDLIVAVVHNEVDACAGAASALAATYAPDEALKRWLLRFVDFVAAKRGLAAALQSGDPAYDALPDYFEGRLGPTLTTLLEAAAAADVVRAGVNAVDLLPAVAKLESRSARRSRVRAPDDRPACGRTPLRREGRAQRLTIQSAAIVS